MKMKTTKNNIKLNITVSRWANFYFFVQNLSEWNNRNRKDYNALWQAELGPFFEREKNALKAFKKVRLRYKSNRGEFERAFFTSKEPLKQLQLTLPTDEFIVIKKVFALFKKKFDILYKKDFPLLKKWQEILYRKINKKSLIKSIISPIEILYNATAPKKTVDIYLLLSAPNHTGGGANVNDQSASIEISRYPTQGINHVLGIIWHEVIHLCFEKQYFVPLLVEYFGRASKSIGLISEIAASSLLPNGILGQSILYSLPPKFLNIRIPTKFNKKLMNIMGGYMKSKKPLDKKYIQNIWTIAKVLQNNWQK